MPSDVTYFIVRPDDIALENFAMVVTSAKLTGTSIVIGYSKENEGTDGRWEGKVYSIVLK